MPRGYMIKVGGPSHLYSESGEMETYNTIAPLMRTPLSPGYATQRNATHNLPSTPQRAAFIRPAHASLFFSFFFTRFNVAVDITELSS